MKIKLILFFSIILINCKTANIVNATTDYEIINAFLTHRKIESVLIKTIQPDFQSYGLNELLTSEGLKLLHYNLKQNNEKIDFSNFFPDHEMLQIKNKFKNIKPQLLKKQEVNILVKNKTTIKIEKQRKISLPILTSNKKFAFIYSEGKSDGDLFCMQLIDNRWIPLFVAPVWSTD